MYYAFYRRTPEGLMMRNLGGEPVDVIPQNVLVRITGHMCVGYVEVAFKPCGMAEVVPPPVIVGYSQGTAVGCVPEFASSKFFKLTTILGDRVLILEDAISLVEMI